MEEYIQKEVMSLSLEKRALFNKLKDAGVWINVALLAVQDYPEHIIQEVLDKIEGQEVEALDIVQMIRKVNKKEEIDDE